MPYKEYEEQALLYFEIAKQKLAKGNKGEALSNFNMAYNIARKNGMTRLMTEIKQYLDEL